MIQRKPFFRYALILAASLVIGGCSNKDASVKRTITKDSTVVAAPVSGRRQLTDAYERLRQRLMPMDRESFAGVLRFPVPDTVLNVIIESPGFDSLRSLNGGMMTRKIYDAYFPELASSMDLASLRELLQRIPAERLAASDSSYAEDRKKTEACFSYFKATLHGDTLSLSCGSDNNDQYRSETDEWVPCEWGSYWTFRFDGKEFRFLSLFQAG